MAPLPREPSHAPGGASLLHALNAAGLRVGVTEVARLHRVFAHEPRISGPEQLTSLLRAALARDDDERAAVERVCAAWLSDVEHSLARGAVHDAAVVTRVTPHDKPQQAQATARARLRAWLRAWLERRLQHAFDAARKLLARVRRLAGRSRIAEVLPDWARSRSFRVGLSAVVVALALLLALGSVGGTAAIMAALGTSTWRLSPLLAMALTATCLIGVALRLRRTIAKPGRDAIGAQAPREFLPAVRAQGHALLDAREQEALVWGIEHFVSEEPTPHLDLPATVRDTAREGGVPRPRFKLARATREVWLWVDESAQDAAAGRLAGEIEAALRAHGLPVERAAFWGLPDPLYPPAGRPFGPNEEEERRDGALVAVLTDGRLLRIQHAVDSARVGIDALLRELARWPRLAFVDFSPGGELRRVLAHHGLDVIAPRRLAVYLGASEAARLAVRPARRAEVDARRREADTWAAACCLAPAGSVDEGAALALARELRVSAWALPLLRAAAPGPPGRLAWTHVQRVRWLDAFAHADVHPAASVAPGSRLDVALRFWERRYDDELGRRQGDAAAAAADEQREDPRHPPPSMRLRIEREALRLWRDPHRAARALHVLYGEALREPIRAYLGRLTPADGAREGCVRLPWDWGHIAAAEQAMLAEMGFASGHAAVRLRAAGRIWLALGVSLSVAAAAVLAPPSAVAVVAVLAALSLSRPWQRRAWARLRSVFAPPAPPAPVDEAVEPPPSRRPLPPGIASLATYRFSVVTVDERGRARSVRSCRRHASRAVCRHRCRSRLRINARNASQPRPLGHILQAHQAAHGRHRRDP
jgi:hypothetical protein